MTTTTSSFGLNTHDAKRRHVLGKSLLVGITAGLLASAFRMSLVFAERSRLALLHQTQGITRIAGSIIIAAVGGAVSVWLVRRWAPTAGGSGIPHLKAVVLGQASLEWRRLIPVKFLSGFCGIGGGFALGREGPTIQMGGATGLVVSEVLKIKAGEGERKALISAGAGAGLAAAFNAPLSGMIFVLEELHGAFTPLVFLAAFLSSIVADVVARMLTGGMPVFTLQAIGQPRLSILPLAALLGAVAGVIGVGFNRALLGSLNFFDRFNHRSPLLVGGLVGIVVGMVGCISPEVVGSGGLIADRALAGEFALHWIPLIFAIRFALTIICYGSGAAGGIFAPLLVLGALVGLSCGVVGQHYAPQWIPDTQIFAVLGMGALLAAVVRAPLTGIVLMVELTGQYNIMLPLLTACLCAHGMAEILRDKPIYEALLHRMLGQTEAHQQREAAMLPGDLDTSPER